MKELIDAPGCFQIAANAGDIVLLPSGYIYVMWSADGAVGLRHGCSPIWEGKDARVKTTLRKVLEEYPNLQETHWGTWAQVLEAQWGIQENWIIPTHQVLVVLICTPFH